MDFLSSKERPKLLNDIFIFLLTSKIEIVMAWLV